MRVCNTGRDIEVIAGDILLGERLVVGLMIVVALGDIDVGAAEFGVVVCRLDADREYTLQRLEAVGRLCAYQQIVEQTDFLLHHVQTHAHALLAAQFQRHVGASRECARRAVYAYPLHVRSEPDADELDAAGLRRIVECGHRPILGVLRIVLRHDGQ